MPTRLGAGLVRRSDAFGKANGRQYSVRTLWRLLQVVPSGTTRGFVIQSRLELRRAHDSCADSRIVYCWSRHLRRTTRVLRTARWCAAPASLGRAAAHERAERQKRHCNRRCGTDVAPLAGA